jgi:hypothetical protein
MGTICHQTESISMKRLSILALLSLVTATTAFAENTLTPLPAPTERPYPFEILGLQPGDSFNDVLAVYSDRTEADPTSESEVLRVQSPEGNVFEFTYQQFSRIGDVGINGRLADAEQDQITARLASGVMEQRPMAIFRSIRKPSDELPEPLELRAQIEETYGPASRVQISGREMTILYTWSTEGFIADLDALPALIHEETTTSYGNTSTNASQYEICGSARHYSNNVDYRFQYPRERDIRTGCIATFRISYRGEPGMTSISFSLEDYELARIHMQELDRQILEALTGDEIEASDMDL